MDKFRELFVDRRNVMGQFLLCVAQYLLIMVVLAGVGVCGGFLGVKLRKSKDAKTMAETSADTKE